MSNIAPHCSARILVAITFHFRSDRLPYLFQVIRALAEFPVDVLDVFVITNIDDHARLAQIDGLCRPLLEPLPAPGKEGKKTLSIESFTDLSDPFYLAWSHKHLIKEKIFVENSCYSHFIYLEEDILLSFSNFKYFLRYMELLRPHKLIPFFQRVEYNPADNCLYFVDQVGVSDFYVRRRVELDGYAFVNLDYPYSAMYIMDRELALEYMSSRSFDRETSREVQPDWAVRERSAMGLCFENLPAGFSHRYVSPVNPQTLRTPSWSWVYHIHNNYVTDRYKPFAKTRVDQIFGPEAALSWQPPPRYMDYLQRARRKITKALAPAK
jgi:hypothetical protein